MNNVKNTAIDQAITTLQGAESQLGTAQSALVSATNDYNAAIDNAIAALQSAKVTVAS